MSPLDGLRDEVERSRSRLARASEELRRSVAADGEGPARDASDALGRLDALRTAIARDVDTLRGRASTTFAGSGGTPPNARVAAGATGLGGIAAGLGVLGALAAGASGRRRRRRRRETNDLQQRARVIAEELRRGEAEPPPRRRPTRTLLVVGALLGVGAAVAVTTRRRRDDEDLWLPEG